MFSKNPAGLLVLVVTILFYSTPCVAIVGIYSKELGQRLCLEIPKHLSSCPTVEHRSWKHVLQDYSHQNITSPGIRIATTDGFGFNVKFQNDNTVLQVREIFMLGEDTEVDIYLTNTSMSFSISCLSYTTPSQVTSSILMSYNTSLNIRYSTDKYPDLHVISDFESVGQIIQSGRFTCRSTQDEHNSETFRIFTQSSAPNGTSPFVTHTDILETNLGFWDRPELTIQKDRIKSRFVVPCRTNLRLEIAPDLLWKKNEDNFVKLTDEEMKSFSWDSSVGFQFNSSERMWEMQFFSCQLGSFEKVFLPTPSRFEKSVLVTAEGHQIGCGLRPRNGSSNNVASDVNDWKARYYVCKTYIECDLSIQLGLNLYQNSYRQFFNTPSMIEELHTNKTFGVLSCIFEHSYEDDLVPEIVSSKFFTGLDSNVYLLPGSFPNSSVIQISQDGGPFYKYQTDLYHEFTCTTINFVISEQVYFIIRHEDQSENILQRDIGSQTPELMTKSPFNVSLHSNITRVICLGLSQDGKLVSAERLVHVSDAFELRVDSATTSSRIFQVGNLQDNLTLVCPITGIPPPDYQWHFNANNTHLVQGANTRSLKFLQIHKDIPGNYTCEARNSDGYKSFEFKVSLQSQEISSKLSRTLIGWIAFGAVLCFILLCAAVVLALKYFGAKRELRNLTPEEALEFLNGIPGLDQGSHAEGPELALHLPFTKCIEPNILTVDRNSVLGKGEFGIVYRGSLHSCAVAVKTFKRSVTYEEFRAGLVEVKLMAFVDEHPNVVKFIGADVTNIEKRDILIVMELSPLGSLEKHLRTLKQSPPNDYVNTAKSQYGNVDERLTLERLFGFCEQIALAMEHLESKKVIHGDLAARNVLIFNDGVVKVTDFGYSRQLYENNMYKPKKNRALPWRWSSIELLRQMEFSTESDIWAFGVTVWEIFTFGNVPFASEKWSEHFMDSLENGLRLPKPPGLSESQYTFLKECWNVEKSARPRFSALKCFFAHEKESLSLYFDDLETTF